MANCGCPAAGGELLFRIAADHVPGCVVEIGVEPGQHHRAMRQRGDGGEQLAVAGIEPVEPAAITGPSAAPSRSASALISRSRRAAGSILPRSCRIAGQCSRAIFRKSQRAAASNRRPRPAPGRRAGRTDTCRVVRSSISRARSSASASAAAGIGDQRRVLAFRLGRRFAHCRDQLCQQQPALAARPAPRARRAHRLSKSLRAASSKAISSSSTSPMATMRGRIAASAAEHIEENVARQPRRAPGRQVERRRCQRQRIGARRKARAPAGRRSSAWISVGRNGAEAGMVKTRGGFAMAGIDTRRASRPEAANRSGRRCPCDCRLRASATASRRADMHPDAVDAAGRAGGPASAARSNSTVSGKTPLGASLNSAGDSSAALA